MNDLETYQCTPEKNGLGTFFFTDCGNVMYSVSNDFTLYHGAYCPRCMYNGKNTVLYLRGTEEAMKVQNVK